MHRKALHPPILPNLSPRTTMPAPPAQTAPDSLTTVPVRTADTTAVLQHHKAATILLNKVMANTHRKATSKEDTHHKTACTISSRKATTVTNVDQEAER